MTKWPEKLNVLVEVLERNLRSMGVPSAHEQALGLSIEILELVIGGDNQYVPKSDKIRAYLRDRDILREFTGTNKDDLARKYRVSTRHIEILVAARNAAKGIV